MEEVDLMRSNIHIHTFLPQYVGCMLCFYPQLIVHRSTNVYSWRKSILSASIYRIALNFHGSLISRIFNRFQQYFSKNFWHTACSVRVQQIRKIISIKPLFTKNLDPRKFSAIRYIYNYEAIQLLISLPEIVVLEHTRNIHVAAVVVVFHNHIGQNLVYRSTHGLNI